MPMTFEQFALAFHDRFCPDNPDPLHESTDLFGELALDSLDAFRLLIFIEIAAGLDVPPDDIPEIFSLGDAFECYRQYSAHAASSQT